MEIENPIGPVKVKNIYQTIPDRDIPIIMEKKQD